MEIMAAEAYEIQVAMKAKIIDEDMCSPWPTLMNLYAPCLHCSWHKHLSLPMVDCDFLPIKEH